VVVDLVTVILTVRISSLRTTLVAAALDQVVVTSSPAIPLRVLAVLRSINLTSGAIPVRAMVLVSLRLDPVVASRKDPVVLDLVASLMTVTQKMAHSKEIAGPLIPLRVETTTVVTLTLVLLRVETKVMMPILVLLGMMLMVISLRTVMEMVVSRTRAVMVTISRAVTLVVVHHLRGSVVVVESN
jgi:hypothetical protein